MTKPKIYTYVWSKLGWCPAVVCQQLREDNPERKNVKGR